MINRNILSLPIYTLLLILSIYSCFVSHHGIRAKDNSHDRDPREIKYLIMVSEQETTVMTEIQGKSTSSVVAPIFNNISLPSYNFPFKLEFANYILWKS